MNLDSIKQKIKNGYKIHVFKINCKKPQLILKGNSKKEIKKKLKKIAENKLDYSIIFSVSIKFYNKLLFDDMIIGLHFNNYMILDGKLKKIHIDNSEGCIWFTKNWIIDNGWNDDYILNAVNIIKSKKGKIIIPGISIYHLLGKN